MSSVAALVANQLKLAYFPHTDVSGDTWQKVKSGTCTSSGAADGTTLIDTNGDSGSANTYNGYWVKLLSGTYLGEWAMVADDDGSGTLTIETAGPTSAAGFPGQVVSGVQYEIWKSPIPNCVVTTATSATVVRASSRVGEGDDFWIGYYLIAITGAARGEGPKLISAFTSSTGEFTCAAFTTAPSVGDVLVLRKFVEIGNLSMTPGEEYIERMSPRTDFSEGDGAIGPRTGSIGFSAQITASGTLAAAASKANASVLAGLLVASGLEEVIGTSMTATAGGTTSALNITTATGERVVPGQMIIHNGNATFVTSITDGGGSDDVLNVSPALPNAPAAADVIYATRMYKKSRDAEISAVGFEVEQDGVRTIITGCKGNVTKQDGPVSIAAFQFTADHWIRQRCISPYLDYVGAAYTTAKPVKPMDRLCYVTGSTKADIGGFTTSPNSEVTPKGVQGASGINGTAGNQLTGYKCVASYRTLMLVSEGMVADLEFHVRTALNLRMVEGSHGNCFAVTMPVARIVETPTPGNEKGMQTAPKVLRAHDAGTATSNLTTSKVPDYAWHLS